MPSTLTPNIILDEEREDILRYLSGQSVRSNFPKAITPAGQGGKFDLAGNVLRHPGNTFLCHIDQTSEFYRALCALQDDIKASPLSENYVFLPKPSFHMTIFCGVSGLPLGDDGWPQDIPNSANLDYISREFAAKLSAWKVRNKFNVRAIGMSMPGTVRMVPATAQDASNLRNIRHQLQELTGLYRDDIDSYEFHISLGYLLRWYNDKTAAAAMNSADELFQLHMAPFSDLELGPIEFCTFQTMHHFEVFQMLGK